MSERPKSIVTMDYDGTITDESPWLTYLGSLIIRRSDILVNVAALYLQRSKLRDDAIEVVKGMYTLGMEVAILTGRFPSLHAFTQKSIDRLKCRPYISKVFLNPRAKLDGWKRRQVGELVVDGYTVFHFENARNEALDVASVGPGSYVYWVNNSAEDKSLPENVIQVPSLTAGFYDLKAKFTQG